MSDNNKSYRIKANIHEDNVLNVNLNNDFNILEVLSLKIGTESLYKFHTSNYGCVAGRVLANEGFGIPNAKISIFISATTEDLEDNILSYLYPYTATSTKNEDNIRYNLLPDEQLSDCHRNVGTFPSKRMVLDDDNVLEVYDKYYKFTTRTNNAGDYIIFGVPVGNQTIHVDIDLSDIGILSQSPRDMIYKGYNINQFENANMFKKSTDLDNLTQIITQNQNVYVYPFWGEESEGDIAISRKDIDIQYEFTPTCVFMGSLITDERSNGISKRCIPSERMGKMDKLTTGKGTIEMIRKKLDGTIEEFIVQGNQLIDGNGVWCYQIPMNLDYVRTDEYGNIVPTDDVTKGIPTRTSVRFRISLTEFETEGEYSHLAKVLVPNNPSSVTGYDYAFGTKTTEESFKDLFWNNVYTVKSYIPRLQMINLDRNKRFSGFKAVNVNNSNNPIPYNNMRVDLTFMFSLQCAIFKILLWMAGALNKFFWNVGQNFDEKYSGKIANEGQCVYLGDGYCPSMEGWYFAPNCSDSNYINFPQNTFDKLVKEEETVTDTASIEDNNKEKTNICLTKNITYFKQCVELTFAMEYDVIQFDFYNDWINGMIYMPRWFADVRQKRSYLWGLIKIKPKINACMEGAFNGIFARRYTQQCALTYTKDNNGNYTKITTTNGCNGDKNSIVQKCHKSKGRQFVKILKDSTPGGGLVHDELVSTGEYAYYFRPCEWVSENKSVQKKCNLFATDIVLLGSLDANNSQGIPQTFKKLVTTSYQMPDPLASTNLGEEGYVYGNKDDSTLCTESTLYGEEGINRLPTNFNSVVSSKTGTDEEEIDPYDEREYAVTEASGIDWGYIGPRQQTGNTNDYDSLYYPGGHFLGISCFNSEVNIKSCINLSRICEMGTLMSQRKTVIKKKSDGSWEYSYLVPTGLISGDDINDYGFKNEFATLNYNGLKTKLNKDTNLLEYDFETINPINFNGELSSKIGAEYNNINGFTDDELGTSVCGATAYRRTLEENSNDYYNFRFNLHKNSNGVITDKEKRLKFLKIVSNSELALPMYENSFYFYFGLKQGNTALDNFYKDFFAECPVLKEYEPSVNIVIKNSDYCSDNGEITINVKKIDEPYYRFGSESATAIFIEEDTATITGLSSGTYKIFIGGDNVDELIEKDANVGKDEPSAFSELSYEKYDYEEEAQPFEELSTNGKIKFTSNIFEDTGVTAILITSAGSRRDKSKRCAKVIYNNNSQTTRRQQTKQKIENGVDVLSSLTESTEKDKEIVAWEGNVVYVITIYYACPSEEELYTKLKGTVNISMKKGMDIYFNNSTISTYKKIIYPMIKYAEEKGYDKDIIYNEWYDIFLNSGYSTFYSEIYTGSIGDLVNKGIYTTDNIALMEYNLKSALYYQNSQSEINDANGSIKYNLYVPSKPYTENLKGGWEYLNGSVLNISNEEIEGYSLNMSNFYSPTTDAPYTKDYYLYDYTKIADKPKYQLNIIDNEGKYLPEKEYSISFPSIYRPFFFRAVYVNKYGLNSEYVRIGISNGITNNDSGIFTLYERQEKVTIKRNEKDYLGPMPNVEPKDFEKKYATCFYSGTKEPSTTYGVTVQSKDKEITKEISVKFIGLEYGVFGTYDENVEYFYQEKGDGITFSCLQGATPCTNVNGKPRIQYNEAYWSKNDYLSKEIIWNDALSSYIRTHYTKIPGSQIRARKINIGTDTMVVGIYDSDISEYYNAPSETVEDNLITLSSHGIAPRHINTISVIKIYEGSEFINLVNNN